MAHTLFSTSHRPEWNSISILVYVQLHSEWIIWIFSVGWEMRFNIFFTVQKCFKHAQRPHVPRAADPSTIQASTVWLLWTVATLPDWCWQQHQCQVYNRWVFINKSSVVPQRISSITWNAVLPQQSLAAVIVVSWNDDTFNVYLTTCNPHSVRIDSLIA